MNPKLLGSLLVGIIVLTGVYIGTLSLEQQPVSQNIISDQQAQVSGALPSGLLAHLTFDDSSLNDASGNNNSGSWSGSPSFTVGKIGNGAATFGGSNYVVINSQVYPLSAGTVAFWFKKNAAGNLTGSYGGSQNQRAPTLSISSTGTLRWEFGGATMNDTGVAIDSNWHHVAMTYSSTGTVRIYLDGTRIVNVSAVKPEAFFNQVHIGHYGNYGSSFGKVSVDDFRIYNKALSASEVSSLYAYTGVTAPSDTATPVISNVSVSDIQTNEVTITWDTNELSDTQLEFGVSTGYGNSSSLKDTGTSMVTSHRQGVVGVQPNTTYNYRVKSRDAAGNLATSANYTFTTAAVADTSAPTTPSGLTSSNVTQTSVSLSWTASTDNVGVTGYEIYRNGVKIDSVTGTSDTDSGLTSNTAYSYTVVAVDAAGNKSSQSSAKSVTTLSPAPTVTLTATPVSITAGQSTTLTWSSTNATSCSGVGGGFTGTQPLSGSKTLTLQSNMTYSIACTGTGGSKDAEVYITVTPAPEVVSTAFKAGDIVQTSVTANVRATGALTGTLLGTQSIGSYATVVGGGVQNPTDKFFWWNLNFITGADGYVGQDGVKLVPVSTAFKVGDRVQTLNQTNVRSNPVISSATLLGSQPTNAIGTIVGGGMLDSSGTFSWWNINYDSGVDGYSGGDNLKLYSAATTFTVTTAKAGTGSGTVSCNPSTCTANTGSTVTVTAVPASGSTFTGWSGACTGTGTCSRTSAGTVTATFTAVVVNPTTFTVTTAKAGTGSGTVSCNPTSCSANTGGTVSVTATPASGSVFAGFSGACSGTSCSLTSAGTVTATFNLVPVTTPNSTKFTTSDRVAATDVLNVRSSPSATASLLGSQALGALGTVNTASNNGIFADGYYWWNINYDTGADGWSVENYLVKYTTPTTFTVTTAKAGTGSGTVSCSPTSCSANTGSSVSVTATPAAGSTFAGWSGACSGTGACSLTSSASVTATFNVIPVTGGTTFHVRPPVSGYVGGNGSSYATAFAGLPSTLTAGATYLLYPGSYPKLTVTSSGTASAPITIRRAGELEANQFVPSAEVVTFASGSVISGSNVIIDGKGWHGFNFSSGTTVAMNGGAVTVLLSGSNVTLKNGFFDGNYGSGYASLGVIPPATGVTTVSYSDFYQSSYEDQLNISASVGGGDVVFDHNVFRDNNKPNRSDTSHRDVSNPWTGTGGWGLTLSNNIFFNTPGHASDQPQGDEFLLQIGYGGSATPLKKVIAFNNVVHNTARFIAFGSQNSGVNEFKVYNNTLRNTTYASSLGITTTAPAIAPTTANNISGSVSGGFVNSNPTSIDAMYGADGRPFTSDDAFALTSGSTVIDKGTGSLISPVDITGKTRTGTADFGAYEFSGTVTTPSTFTVTTAKAGTGSGIVSCNPSTCSIAQGSTVLVSATAASGSTLASMTVSPTSAGSCTINSCALTAAGTVTATFNLIPVTGTGGNWYLNANVSASGNGTSWSNAWKNTSNIVWSSIQPGDTLWIAGGSYGALAVAKSGTAAKPIYIKRVLSTDAIPTAAAGWSSSLDSRATFTGYDALSAPVSYVEIDGRVDMGLRFVLSDSTNGLPSSYNATGGNYITLNSVDLVGPNAVARPDGSSTSNPLVNHAGDTSGVKIGYGYSPNPGADNITIRNSRVRGHANEFWFANARNITIENNKIYDNGAANSVQWHGNLMIVNGSNGIIFRNNDVYNWQVEGLYPWGSASKNWYVYGNVFHDGIGGKNGSTHRFLELRSYSGSVTHGPFYVYNNTVANAYAAFTRGDTTVYWSADSVARNNLVYNVAGGGVGYLPAQASNNLYYSTSPFVSATDYSLKAGIAGVSVPNVTTVLKKSDGTSIVTDFEKDPTGKTRGADGVWDVGAYEY